MVAEVSRGRKKSRALAGAGLGFLSGAVVGAVIGRSAIEGDINETGANLLGAGYGAIPGTLIGTLIGASMGGESWEEVPLEKVHQSIVPRGNSVF